MDLKRVPRARRLGAEKKGEEDKEFGYFAFSKSDESQSILDNPAYDLSNLFLQEVFPGDGRKYWGDFGAEHRQLPWVVLNNRGLINFLEENFEGAKNSYEELNQRIPNNIIFLYRLGLCFTILAFKNKKEETFRAHIFPIPKI